MCHHHENLQSNANANPWNISLFQCKVCVNSFFFSKNHKFTKLKWIWAKFCSEVKYNDENGLAECSGPRVHFLKLYNIFYMNEKKSAKWLLLNRPLEKSLTFQHYYEKFPIFFLKISQIWAFQKKKNSLFHHNLDFIGQKCQK